MAMKKVVPLVAAGAVAGILGVGGASLALAQEEPSTTTPSTDEEQTPSTGEDQAPSTTPDESRPGRGDGSCPEKDGSEGNGSGPEGSSLLFTT